MSDDATCADPLTPNHFLIGRGSVFGPDVVEDPENVSVTSLCQRESVRRSRLEQFWRVWLEEYVRNLPAAVPKFSSRGGLQIGSVVMIHRDSVPRLRWPCGTVEKLHPGKDGVVRSVDVPTSKGVYKCAVQRLHSLELVSASSDVSAPGDVSCVPGDGPCVPGDGGVSRPCAGQAGSIPSEDARADVSVRTRSGRVSRPPVRFS